MSNETNRRIPEIDFLEDGSPPSCCRLLSMLSEAQEVVSEAEATRTGTVAHDASTTENSAETEFGSEHG